MHRLEAPAFIDVEWFNQVRYGTHEVALQGKTVLLNGVTMRIEENYPEQVVYVFLHRDGFFYMQTKQEREELVRIAKQEREEREAKKREAAKRYRQEAEEFNAQFNIPVEWTTGYKAVLSGLSENSWGDGRYRSTVNHILLQEDLQQGRLKRKAGDFLCSATERGKRWGSFDDPVEFAYDDNGAFQPKISCQSCLKIAERWKRNKNAGK